METEPRKTAGKGSPLPGSKYWMHSNNPLRDVRGGFHCTKCAPECQYCWAEGFNLRTMKGKPYDGQKTEFYIDEKVLAKLSMGGKPKTFFVCDMCDLFHEDVPFELQERILMNIPMSVLSEHIYLITTKRPYLMSRTLRIMQNKYEYYRDNLWLGVSLISNQYVSQILTDNLLRIDEVNRWLSIEPLIGAIDLSFLSEPAPKRWRIDTTITSKAKRIDWVVVGAESGHERRPSRIEWVRHIVQQCQEFEIPVFVKQLDIGGKLIRDINKFPEDLRVRELPFLQNSEDK